MVENKRWRTIIFYKEYFSDFFVRQRIKVKQKITWTFDLIEEHERVPEIYLKHLESTDGLYEIKIQHGSDEIRIFCFFDKVKWLYWQTDFIKRVRRHQRRKLKKH